MAADYLHLTVNPTNPDGPRIHAIFPAGLTLRSYKYAPVRYWNLITAKYVLAHVERIFFGVREYNEGGWCYTTRPRQWYVAEKVTAPFPDGRVFAVYLNPNMRVYECRAEEADPADMLAPKDWQDRYRGLVWKRTS